MTLPRTMLAGMAGTRFQTCDIVELVGRVTTNDGRPAVRIEVEVRSSRGLEASAMTNADGRYQLKVSRLGQYQLGVNLTHTATQETPYSRWFYPGTEDPSAAAAIELQGRPDIRTYDFRLPVRQNERSIEDFVRMADGRPAPAASIVRIGQFTGCGGTGDSRYGWSF